MTHVLRLIIVVIVLAVSPAYAASLEQTFVQAQEAYKAGRYAESAGLFTQAADALLKAKETAKAQMVLGNAAIALIKGEDHNGAIQVYERILKMPGQTPPDVLLKSYKNMIVSHGALGHQALKVQAIERMLKAIPKLPPSELANAYAQLGDAYRALELYAKAEESYKRSLSLQAQDADPKIKARLLTAMGLCQGQLGRFENASESLTQARTLAGNIKEALTIAESDSNLGILYWERGDYPQALQLLKAALDTEEKATLRRNQGVEKNNLGLVEKSIGRYANAMTFFEESLTIAREVSNKRDEAIALSNRALLNRMTGNLNEARTDYRAALKLYEEVGFQEGKAGVLLGVGKIAELEDRNLDVALNNYKDALAIYRKIGLPRNQAESLLQIAGVLKRTATPGRTTRDLVFDDEPTTPKIDKATALKESANAYAEALKLAEMVNSKEMTWAALQGVGYGLMQQNKLEESFVNYMKAIDIVTKMRNNLNAVSLLGEYMAGKEDLYNEAMEVCAKLHEKTKDKKYVEWQIRLDETLRNEISKASTALVQMNFADKKKQDLYEKLNAMSKKSDKAESAIPVMTPLARDASDEAKATHALKTEEAKKQKVEAQKLEGDYQKLLGEWKKDYPADAVMFESTARVDIPAIQKALKADEVMLQYISLQEKLIIVAISANNVENYIVNVSMSKIDSIIKKEFLLGYLEVYGRFENKPTDKEEKTHLENSLLIMKNLYDYLILPVDDFLKHKKRIYVSTTGFLSQVPFVSLIASKEGLDARFLVEDFEIGYIRPSFIVSFTEPNQKKSTKNLLAVGNPKNSKVTMANLEGAKREIELTDDFLSLTNDKKDIEFGEKATDSWFLEKISNTNYETIYFATHGMPFSEVYLQYFLFSNKENRAQAIAQKYELTKEKVISEIDFIQQELPSLSPLNGYLYMGIDDKNPLNGLLTLKKIAEIPDKSLASTKYVLLSACNTGVTFAPKTLISKDDKDSKVESAFKGSNVEADLRKAGWLPGVDQVSFVDVFMRRGINNVYGTLWFASDESSAYLVSNFMSNLHKQGDNQDAVLAYTETLRAYIKDSNEGKKPLGNKFPYPLHPYFWAVGAIFGK